MLDGLLGRGFSSKSKSLIKLIKARIDMIRRKRNAVQKFLKKDVADLLKNGLDINAYGRAAGLMVELDMSYCYDALEQFCGLVARHLSIMPRQSECPEECKEAVATLMFAAARFADVPELRDLRNIFMEKYGNSLVCYVSQEFVKKQAGNPPLADTKLQLMQDIAKEFSIIWDRRAFELTLSSAPGSLQDQPQRHRLNDRTNGVCRPQTGSNTLKKELQDASSFGRPDPTDGYKHNLRKETTSEKDRQDKAGHGRHELPNRLYKAHGGQEETTLHGDNQDTLPQRRWGSADNGLKPGNDRGYSYLQRDHQQKIFGDESDLENNGDIQDTSPYRRWGSADNGSKPGNGKGNGYIQRDHQQKTVKDESELENNRVETLHKRGNQETSSYRDGEYISSYGRKQTVQSNHNAVPFESSRRKDTPDRGSEKVPPEVDSVKPQIRKVIPPPYVKPNVGKYGAQNAASLPDKSPIDRPIYDRDLSENRTESSQSRFDHNYHERQVVGSAKSGRGDEKTQYDEDELVVDTKPMPKSVRRRQKLPPPPGYEHMSNAGADDEIEKRHRRSNRRHEEMRRNGLQLALDDEPDEEEKMMDRLLMHFSKKPSKYDAGKVQSGSKAKADPSSLNNAADEGHSRQRQNTDGARTNAGPFGRIRSLPTESVSSPSEAARLPTRATSFEPDILNQAGHVHPKLPDIDDLTARFNALRGRR